MFQDLFFDAGFISIVRIFELEALATTIATPALSAVAAAPVLDYVLALAIAALDSDMVLHRFLATNILKQPI